MYRKKQYIQGSVLSVVSGIHGGSWNGPHGDKEGPLYQKAHRFWNPACFKSQAHYGQGKPAYPAFNSFYVE